MTIEAGQRFTFTSPFEQYGSRVGQAATVLGPVDPDTYDADECGPMWHVRFEDGTEIEAWPEEIDPSLLA
jgi:hypothetical protein